jgi:Baseplate J-like protein
MSPSYLNIPISTDPDADFDAFVAHMQTAFPGWEAAEGNLESWLARWWAIAKVDLAELAADVPVEIFRKFGEEIIGIPSVAAAPATGVTTWTMVDNAGYTVSAGTAVSIALSGSESFDFVTLSDFTVPPGSTVTATGAVAIEAIVPGSDANLLSADPTLVNAITGVKSIALEGTTSGGVDAEDASAYLDRLVAELRLLTPRPILPNDVATLARRVPGVARALPLDGYDPVAATYGHERMVTVAVMDENGLPCDAATKAEVDALLEDMRELNFVFEVIDPKATANNTIKVSTTVQAVRVADLDVAGLQASISATISNYLSALNWGRSPFDGDEGIWIEQTTVRRFELLTLVDSVEGVDYVTALTLARQSGTLGTTDVVLDGPAGVPAPGTITVTVTP